MGLLINMVSNKQIKVVDENGTTYLVATIQGTGDVDVRTKEGKVISPVDWECDGRKHKVYLITNEKGEKIGELLHDYLKVVMQYAMLHNNLPKGRPV